MIVKIRSIKNLYKRDSIFKLDNPSLKGYHNNLPIYVYYPNNYVNYIPSHRYNPDQML